MPIVQDPWLTATEKWFDLHPEREFRITDIPLASLPPVAMSGWLGGVASQPSVIAGRINLVLPEGTASVPCIVRRADPIANRKLPTVFLLDGAGAMPPLPDAHDRARAEEKFAEQLWRLAQHAAVEGVSLLSVGRWAGSERT